MYVLGYYVYNGDRSHFKELGTEVEDIELLRSEIEEKENCFTETFFGKERIKYIYLVYGEKKFGYKFK